jgi:N-acetylglucosaminyldiphosphoundecaprenol N-acetyl-beta-D-mannosaminyltransferase
MNPRPPAPPAPTYDLLGVDMSILNIPDAVRRILGAVEQRQRGYICVTGVHGIMESRSDHSLKNILNNAFLCTPDGMPTVWMGKLSGHPEMSRVYGPDLMLAVMEATRDKPVRHFFYGGQEGVAEDLKAKLEQRFPGLQITGTFCPPFRALKQDEVGQLQDKVHAAKADIFWVGLSTPKQERFMAEYLPQLDTSVMVGVGAAFDFHSGRVKQAPAWIQQNGLEWLYRVMQEPRRLWRRYFSIVPRFILLVAAEKSLGRSAFDGLGGFLFRLLPWLVLGGFGAMLGALILHPAQWLQILSAGGASLLALAITSALAMNASEEANVSVLPVLPWLAASLGVVFAAVGGLAAHTSLMTIALWIALATVALWLVLISVAGLTALAKGSVDAPT